MIFIYEGGIHRSKVQLSDLLLGSVYQQLSETKTGTEREKIYSTEEETQEALNTVTKDENYGGYNLHSAIAKRV